MTIQKKQQMNKLLKLIPLLILISCSPALGSAPKPSLTAHPEPTVVCASAAWFNFEQTVLALRVLDETIETTRKSDTNRLQADFDNLQEAKQKANEARSYLIDADIRLGLLRAITDPSVQYKVIMESLQYTGSALDEVRNGKIILDEMLVSPSTLHIDEAYKRAKISSDYQYTICTGKELDE